MRMRERLLGLVGLGAIAACNPMPPPQSPVASPVPVAPASVAPSAQTPVATATPSPTPSAWTLSTAKRLGRYDFEGIGGVHYAPALDELFVIDGVNSDRTPRRYLLRRFTRAGVFRSVTALQREGEKAPDQVEGVAFDLRGTLFYTWVEDEALKLNKLFTAAIVSADRLPVTAAPRVGFATLGAQGDVVTLGMLKYDIEEKTRKTTNKRRVAYVRGEEDETPEAIFDIDDPFAPTRALRVGPDGDLYVMGLKAGGGAGFGLLGKDQQWREVSISVPGFPDRFWVGPNGDWYLAQDGTGATAARLRRFSKQGLPLGETSLQVSEGNTVLRVLGLCFDVAGVPIMALETLGRAGQTDQGLYVFE